MRTIITLGLILLLGGAVQAVPDCGSPFGVVCPWGGLKEAGIDWVRTGAGATALGNWCDIQKTRGSYSWESSDNEFRSVLEQGLTPLPILGYTPGWASSGAKEEVSAPPKDILDYATFVGAVAKRYEGKIPCYEIWNEPDIGFWSGTVADYADLLKTGYIAAKQADPKCQIVFGGMAGVNLPFLRSVYEFGGRDFFDIMAVHPYQWGTEFNDEWFVKQLLDLREMMDKQGDQHKEIWLTEFGWSTGDKGITEEIQARLLTQGLVTAMTLQKMGVTRTFWFCVKDWGGPGYGLLRPDGSKKPAYNAYSVLTKTLRNADYAGKIDLGQDVRCHVFRDRKSKSAIAAIWAPKETTVTMPGKTPSEIIDHLGNEVALKTSGQQQARPEPIFVTGADPALLKQAKMPYAPRTTQSSVLTGPMRTAWVSVVPQEGAAKPYLVAGQETPLTVRIQNQCAKAIAGRLSVSVEMTPQPPNFNDRPKTAGASYSVPAMDVKLVTVAIRVPASAKPGPAKCVIDGLDSRTSIGVQITDGKIIDFTANSTVESRYLVRNENSGGAPSVRFNGSWTYKFDLTDSKRARVEMNVGAHNAQEWRVLASDDEKNWRTILSGKSNRAWHNASLSQYAGGLLYLKFEGTDQQLEQLVLHY